MSSNPLLPTPLPLMNGPLAGTFGGPSWDTWRAVLKAAFGADLSPGEREIVERVTHRTLFPRRARELWFLLGRRSGKSIIAALLAVWMVTCRRYTLAPGEVGVLMVVAADRRQARVVKRYIAGLLRSHAALDALLARETADAIWLTNGLCVEIHTCSIRSPRGYTAIGAIVDEVAFWAAEDSANPDREVLVALRAAMASVPEALLVGVSTVYVRRGEVARVADGHFGNNDSDTFVANGPTRLMNPTISEDIIAAAYADDPVAAAAEYGAEWRRDVEAFLPPDALEAVRMEGRLELPFDARHRYVGFLDPAGGTGRDSMTLAIAHEERGRAVLDLVREAVPPFSPESVVTEFAQTLRAYRLSQATSDRYAGSWPTEAFRKQGIQVTPSDRTRSEIYLAVLPMVMSQRVELLDHPKLLKQLGSLERRKGRQGRDSVDAPPGPRHHEDVANAAAGALVLAGVDTTHNDIAFARLTGH